LEWQRDVRVLLTRCSREALRHRRVIKGRLLRPLLGIDPHKSSAARHRDSVNRLVRLRDPGLGLDESGGEIRESLVDRSRAPIVLESC
jgi:hypothetical protein